MVQLGRAKVFRDPVHDTIDWRAEGDVGRLICTLIDQPEVQRLRFVQQLGMASRVYGGAEHSRFVHSLGVAHVARRMLARVEPNASDDVRATVLCAALLHDVGHGPFSHVFERVFDFHHEDYSRAVIESPRSGVHQVLRLVDASLPERVVELIAGGGAPKYNQIVSSQLDADRFDYLLRDSMMTGVVVGRYDLERILLLLRSDDKGLLVDERGWESVEGYLIARYHMYRLVYFHRTVRAMETMLECLFRRARKVVPGNDPSLREYPLLRKLLSAQRLDPEEWMRLREYNALGLMDRWQEHEDRILQVLARGFMERRVMRSVDRVLENDDDRAQEERLLQRLEDGLSPDERDLFSLDEASHSTYQPYIARRQTGGQPIRVLARSGRVELIEQLSPVVRALGQTATRLRRWHVHPLIVEKVRFLTGVDI